jgi:hypothetical protein
MPVMLVRLLTATMANQAAAATQATAVISLLRMDSSQ